MVKIPCSHAIFSARIFRCAGFSIVEILVYFFEKNEKMMIFLLILEIYSNCACIRDFCFVFLPLVRIFLKLREGTIS